MATNNASGSEGVNVEKRFGKTHPIRDSMTAMQPMSTPRQDLCQTGTAFDSAGALVEGESVDGTIFGDAGPEIPRAA